MFLTPPYIDQAISQVCAFHSPFSCQMSAMEICRQSSLEELRFRYNSRYFFVREVKQTAG